MTYSSNLTKKRILDCAEKEFIAEGFTKANMRTIAENAKVTTGAMYNHFKSKEILFEAFVGEVATGLLDIFEKEYNKCEKLEPIFCESTQQIFEQDNDWIFDYIYLYLDEIKLLIGNTTGTKYEHFMEELIKIEEKSILCLIKNQGVSLEEIDTFFVHILSSSTINNMFEPIRHNLSKSEAIVYMEKLHRFHYAGWIEILGR